jgi:7-carboxy-7-deazaguanine synthase
MIRVYVSEVFRSIQGEGVLTGTPSVFIRTSGCNLRCAWCDTPETSWRARGEQRTVASLLAEVASHAPVRHVVLTGGEPALARHLDVLAAELAARGHHLTLETAGTVWRDLPVDLWSISPKLANSTPDHPTWGPRHEAARLAPAVIRRMLDAAGAYQLKFVVATRADLPEIDAFVDALGASADRVLLMPEATDVAQLDATARWLVDACAERGYRFGDRLHLRLFGNTRGT